MKKINKHNQKFRQSGNIFLSLFAAIAVVGAVGAGSVTVLKGPVQSMVSLNRQGISEMRMEIAAKLLMADSVDAIASDGDTTEYLELSEYAAPVSPSTAPTGGGVVPAVLGINDIDAWQTQFGYCTWDHGSVDTGRDDGGTGTANRLQGEDPVDLDPDTGSMIIALVSAGPNRAFETTCTAYDGSGTEGVNKPSGSDDIVVSYTYQNAVTMMGDLWRYRSDTAAGSENVIGIQTNLDLRANTAMSGLLSFDVSGAGLVLPTASTCNSAAHGQLFKDDGTDPPSIVYCDTDDMFKSVVAAGSSSGTGGDVTSGLVGYWKLDEEEGIYTADYSGNSLHGTLTNMDAGSDWVTGQFNNSLDFDSSNDQVVVPHNSKLDLTGQLSISFWVDRNSVTGTQDFIAKTDGANIWQYAVRGVGDEISFYYCSGTGADCTVGPSDTELRTSSANMTTGTWYHVVITYNDTFNRAKIYVDGAEAATSIISGTPSASSILSSSEDFQIGWSNASGTQANATLDDVRVYNRELTSAEVANLYNYTPTEGSLLIAGGNIGAAACAGLGDTNYYDSDTGTCYFRESTSTATWANAQLACQAEGGHLVVIDSAAEQTLLWSNLGVSGQLTWLGANEIDVMGEWRWQGGELNGVQFWSGESGGSAIGSYYNNWGSGEPNLNSFQACMQWGYFTGADDGKWDDVECSQLTRYICEIPGSGSSGSNTDDDLAHVAYAWGDDTDGTIGNGATTTTDQYSPVLINNSTGFVDIAANRRHACATKVDGTFWCWGHDGDGQQGNGSGVTSTQTEPQQVAGLSNIIDGATTEFTSCALNSSGTIYCWGAQIHGIQGNGVVSSTDTHDPAALTTYTDFIEIDAGETHMCGLRSNGEIYCWGRSNNGEVGIVNTDNSTPLKAGTYSDYVAVATGGYHSCGLRLNGDVYCWGANTDGCLGNGDLSTDTPVPQLVLGGHKFIDIEAGWQHTCGITEDGSALCWGSDNYGQLGNGSATTTAQSTPVEVSNINDFIQITAGGSMTCGVTSTGDGYCWGRNNTDGQLGDTTTTNRDIPTLVDGSLKFTNIFLPYEYDNWTSYGIAVTTSGGNEAAPVSPYIIRQTRDSGDTHGSYGLSVELGSTTADHDAGVGFHVDATATAGTAPSAAIMGVRKASDRGALAFKTASTTRLYMDEDGDMAVANTTSDVKSGLQINEQSVAWDSAEYGKGLLVAPAPVSSTDQIGWFGVEESTGVASILFSKDFYISLSTNDAAIQTDIARFINGSPVQLYTNLTQDKDDGKISITSYSGTAADMAALFFHRYGGTIGAPAVVPADAILGKVIFQGHDGTSLDADGQAQIMAERDGAAGAGTLETSLKIKMAPDGVMNDAATALEIEPNGKVFIGDGDVGANAQLEIAGRAAANRGVQVGDDTNCGGTDEGTIRYNSGNLEYCDGAGNWGALPSGSGGGGSSGTCEHLSGYSKISMSEFHACAVHLNGKVSCWGENFSQGNLGPSVSASGDYPTPQQISPYYFKDVIDITALNSYSSCALKKDGTVWCWGENSIGELGNGTNTDNPIPGAVKAPVSFKKIDGGYHHACGIDDNDTVWCWGINGSKGTAGVNDTSTLYFSTPQPVFNMSGIIDVAAGDRNSCALRKDGTVWCWGSNDTGELGDGNAPTDSPVPVEVSGLTNVIKISAGGYVGITAGVCAVKDDGTVWCWGGEGGTDIHPSGANTDTPEQITGISNAIDVMRGAQHACALINDGTVECWGADWNSQLGNSYGGGSTSSPQTVTGITNAVALSRSAGHAYTTCAILADGNAQCWGQDDTGQTADGTVTAGNHGTPVDTINPYACDADKFVFATSAEYQGDLGGIEGADAICQMHADAAGLPGTYYAWISTTENSPSLRFNQNHGIYYLPNGAKIADNWGDLTDASVDININLNEFGNSTFNNYVFNQVWTSTSADGTLETAAGNCANWTTNRSSYNATFGRKDRSNTHWTYEPPFTTSCNNFRRLYCFQQ